MPQSRPDEKPALPRRWQCGGLALLLFGLGQNTLPAQAPLAVASDAFRASEDWLEKAGLSFLFDLEGYHFTQYSPGLLLRDGDFVTPRFSMFFERQLGRHFSVFVQARADQGFDPTGSGAQARLDEYFLRWTPLSDASLNLQFGKFSTVVGNYVQRHDSWNNPFINAPLPYENVTLIGDEDVPSSAKNFLSGKGWQRNTYSKTVWLPVIWGPAYTSGGMISGSFEHWDYAFELKNASISSRPAYWGIDDCNWRYPTGGARVGYRPNAAWNLGMSFSYGTYLNAEARDFLPAGRSLYDYNQITLAWDASYAWHRWQFWGEVFTSRFQVPNTGNADTLAYYLEAKYKFTPNLFGALRWNQQFFGGIDDGFGNREPWDMNAWRIDTALGYRFNRHVQVKTQYSFLQQAAPSLHPTHLLASQLTLKF